MQMRKREDVVDAVRGFALFGICVVNIPFLGVPSDQLLTVTGTSLDRTVAWLIEALFQGKFFLLFSFLFGWGVAGALNAPVQGVRYARRLIGLALFGVAHAVLVFHGDILLLYALLGVLLWPLRNAQARSLVKVALAMIPISMLAMGLLGVALMTPVPPISGLGGPGYLGGFGDALHARVEEWPQTFAFIALFNGPLAFGAFVLGLAAARDGFFTPGNASSLRLRRSLPWLLPTALILNAGYAGASSGMITSDIGQLAGLVVLSLGAPALSACYVVGIIEAQRAGWLGEGLRAPGRMSLTAYVAEGVVAGLIFNGYGLGFYGKFGTAALFATAVIVFAIVHVFAMVWSRHIGRGPLERILGRIIGAPAKA
jgi:uncharacterized protein